MNIGKYKIIKSPSDIINDGLRLTFKNDTYSLSYPEFLKYFKQISIIDEHHFIIGINFTYGWMPTIFNFKSTDFTAPVEILNKVKDGRLPSEDELLILKSVINNSLVGTSKILHFINPSLIPIWDSRVFKYLIGKNSSVNSIGEPKNFLDYIKFCKKVIDQKDFPALKNHVETEIGHEITPMRAVEIIMYLRGG